MPRPLEPIVHGTPQGYKKHLRRNIPHSVCVDACKKAWAEDKKSRRQKGNR